MHAEVNYDPFRIQKAKMSLWAWNFSIGLKNGLFQQNRPPGASRYEARMLPDVILSIFGVRSLHE